MLSLKPDIKDFSKDQLADWLAKRGLRPFRAGQIFKWVYLRQSDSFDDMTDISKNVRQELAESFVIARLKIDRTQESKDGSKKYLFRLKDGKHIESVLIPEKNHHTLCISSQVGCAQGCRFCMTAQVGFSRNLSPGEIIAQIRDIQNTMDEPKALKNIVFMGMGEPLANYQNLITAITTITDGDYGLKFSTRRVTVSTSGILSKLPLLGRDTSANLAISLNGTDNKTRNFLMPLNKKWPLEELIAQCRQYPLPPRRKITFEYILIKGINDADKNAIALTKLLKGMKAKINLIPFNEHEGSDFKRPEQSTIDRFISILHSKGFTAIVRYSKGLDISAACGQLSAEAKAKIAEESADG